MPSSASLLVRHARLAGGRPGDRERLAAALDRVSLPALGLPPRGTLVLGRVVAPAPLAFDRSPEGFARQLEESLRRRVAQAGRGQVRAEGADWLFEDEEDLEVALVAVWLARKGAVPALLRIVAGSDAPDLRTRWRRTILTDGRRAAPTIARLAEARLAEAWLAGFEAGELLVAAERIRVSHGGTLGTADPEPVSPHETATSALSRTRRETRRLAGTISALAPEARAVPQGALARLLLTALVARRRPALIALCAFIDAVKLAAAVGTSSPRHDPRRAEVPAEFLVAPAMAPGSARPDQSEPLAANSRSERSSSSALGASAPRPETPQPAIPATLPLPFPYDTFAATLPTDFGGLLFVLNAFVALGLWGDFTRPRDTLEGLSPFELLLLLGRHWYGRTFAADPLHGVLRDLSALRPGEKAGSHFPAPEWCVPPDWFAPWPAAQTRQRNGAAWHGAGFPLEDPCHAERTPAARRRYWVVAMGRYLGARLAAALGESGGCAARNLVCRRPGRIVLAPGEMVLHFPLQGHPLAIRFAGLDRDPGRLAGTERSVRFEFTA